MIAVEAAGDIERAVVERAVRDTADSQVIAPPMLMSPPIESPVPTLAPPGPPKDPPTVAASCMSEKPQ